MSSNQSDDLNLAEASIKLEEIRRQAMAEQNYELAVEAVMSMAKLHSLLVSEIRYFN